jgi:hypothetical protein
MKVADNRKTNFVDFDYIDVGGVFVFGPYSSPYMRTEEHCCSMDTINAVSLLDGELAYFGDHEQVIEVNAKVVIE